MLYFEWDSRFRGWKLIKTCGVQADQRTTTVESETHSIISIKLTKLDTDRNRYHTFNVLASKNNSKTQASPKIVVKGQTVDDVPNGFERNTTN